MLNQNVLVCGGSGFIGTNLVYKLLKANFTVINIDKQSYSSVPEKFKDYRNIFFINRILVTLKKLKKLF